LIAESTTDAIEAQAFTFKNQINDVYSASWGPSDDGTSVDGPGTLGKRAMQQGVTNGRDGRGSIFVFASGNGGQQRDNCNFDGYANSIHTVAVGAITWSGKKPWYGEECSAHLAVVYSGGEGLSITTTDINHECTSQHSGTSAAAPLASGMIALMLSARPELGWRDIQQIIVETAQMTDETDADWVKNGAGRMVSHKYGFGKMDAEKLVNRGLKHTILPTPALTFSIKEQSKELMDYNVDDAYQSDLLISEEQANAIGLASLEHVQVTVSITHPERSHLRITLVSPSGTKSLLAAVRPKDESKSGYDPWTFMTVRNWGESAAGVWSLLVEDGRYGRKDENGAPFAAGYLSSWELILHGTCSSSDITEITKESTGRKSLTCAATVKKSEQVQRELMVGFLVFVIGTSIAFTAYAIYRYRLHRPADKYFPARDDAESPSNSSIYERIGLINMRTRADDLESPDNLKPWSNSVDSSPGSGSSPWSNAAKSPSPSYNVSLNGRPRAVPRMAESPSLSTAQNRLALLDQTRNDDEYNSDEDLQADPPQSSITNFAPIVPSNISSLKPNGGGLHRTNSASRPLNLMVADSNKSMSNLNDNPRVLTRSASSMRVLDRGISESALRKGDSLSELRKPLTRSRSGMIDPKSA
jgi:subtilisin-like proprotein convertase family protein